MQLSNSPVAMLYELHSQALFAYLCRQTQSREDAEDLLVGYRAYSTYLW
ncbi:MAG TPA: hypothetical protein VFN35_21650 [Ktedonobacteraceae bacterium]|nr:hypothetical protein [Ktedonobacteraceae bacterium]